MQKFVQKYVLVTVIEDFKDGAEFPSSSWPLHITIASNFTIKCSVSELLELLETTLSQSKPFELVAGKDEYFGPQKQTRVTLLHMNNAVKLLHGNVVSTLKSIGAIFDEPAYVRGGFRAHATVQAKIRLHEGDTVAVNGVSLVDMFPNSNPDQRKIIKTLELFDNKT